MHTADENAASTGIVDALPVPATAREEDYWVAETDGMTSRRQMAAASGSYERTITPAIAALRLSIPADLATDIEEAAAALASFDRYAASALGPDSPTLGPMSTILLRTESASSSQIENLTVSARQLAMAQIEESTSDNARVVAANVAAMEAALRLADHLDAAAILEMHRVLLIAQRDGQQHAGRFRDQLVWVGTSAVSPRGAAHVAPHHERVPGAIEDLVAFMGRDDLPVLVQAAIAHAQFETIHPFADGNGRTARLVEFHLLLETGIPSPAAHLLSNHYNQTRSEYYRQLDSTSKSGGDILPFIQYAVQGFVDGLRSQLEYVWEQQWDIVCAGSIVEASVHVL